MKEYTLLQINYLIGGKIVGSEETMINDIGTIEKNKVGDIVYVEKESFLSKVASSKATALIVPENITSVITKPHIKVKDPKLAFITLLKEFYPAYYHSPHIDKTSNIGVSASIGSNVTIMRRVEIMDYVDIGDYVVIYPGCYIGHNVKIGSGTVIHPNVVIHDSSIIGANNIIYSGVIIGSDGYGYYDKDGIRHKIPQVGYVETDEYVEIGANTCIDRATIGKTFIGKHTKIDNLVQIAHNCTIGENCYITAQVGIAGSCKIGNNVILAGQAGIVDHSIIEDNVIVCAQSGVSGTVTKDQIVLGSPYREADLAKRIYVASAKLPELLKRVKELEKNINYKNHS